MSHELSEKESKIISWKKVEEQKEEIAEFMEIIGNHKFSNDDLYRLFLHYFSITHSNVPGTKKESYLQQLQKCMEKQDYEPLARTFYETREHTLKEKIEQEKHEKSENNEKSQKKGIVSSTKRILRSALNTVIPLNFELEAESEEAKNQASESKESTTNPPKSKLDELESDLRKTKSALIAVDMNKKTGKMSPSQMGTPLSHELPEWIRESVKKHGKEDFMAKLKLLFDVHTSAKEIEVQEKESRQDMVEEIFPGSEQNNQALRDVLKDFEN